MKPDDGIVPRTPEQREELQAKIQLVGLNFKSELHKLAKEYDTRIQWIIINRVLNFVISDYIRPVINAIARTAVQELEPPPQSAEGVER